MYVNEVGDFLRMLVDDPNQVFLSPSRLATFLQQGYLQYHSQVSQQAPEVFETFYQPAAVPSGAYELNLDGVLFGANPSQRRCQRMTRVVAIDPATGLLIGILQPAASYETLAPNTSGTMQLRIYPNIRWWLDGRVLRFSAAMTLTIQIWYIPDPNINWAQGLATPGTYIDDLTQFHDLIALKAARFYYVADGAANAEIARMTMQREADMNAYFAETRSGRGSRYVLDESGGFPR